MRKLLMWFFCLATTVVTGQYTIQVHVQDAATQAPLAGATIAINQYNLVTNDSGNAVQKIIGKKISIKAAYTGYHTQQWMLDIRQDTVLVLSLQQKEVDPQDLIVVASSRTNSRISNLATKVEVLGEEEVQEENQVKPGNIASLLGDIAGVQIQPTNAATGNADMRIQGLPGKYTQILRDGMPLFGGYSSSFGILQLPPLDLQQIELVKGAASTLYGGGAIAGMVNLVSKKPRMGEKEKSITLNRSTLKENNVNLFLSGRSQKIGYTFFAGGTWQNATDVNNNAFSDVPDVRSVLVHPRLFVYGKKQSTLILGYTLNYEDRKGGDMQVLNGKPDNQHQFFIQNKTLRNAVDVHWEKTLPNKGVVTAKGNLVMANRQVATQVFGMKASQALWYSEVNYTRRWKQHHWVAGVNFNGDDFRKQGADSSRFPNESAATLGAFVQDDWQLHKQWTLQGGIRLDYHTRWNMFVLPRLSVMFKPSADVTMRLGGGLGYKTPALFSGEMDERDYKYLAGYNTNIRPEESWGASYDINYRFYSSNWRFTFNQSFFITSIQHPFNLEYSLGGGYARYFNETHPLQTMGAETYVQATREELEIYLGYVFTDARRKYDPVNPHLPLIAQHKLAGIVSYEFSKRLRAGIESAWNGKQYLSDGSTTPSYFLLAAMVRYGVGKFSFVLNGENLLDFRQSRKGTIVFPPYSNPQFPEIWAPLEGRVINLSILYRW